MSIKIETVEIRQIYLKLDRVSFGESVFNETYSMIGMFAEDVEITNAVSGEERAYIKLDGYVRDVFDLRVMER